MSFIFEYVFISIISRNINFAHKYDEKLNRYRFSNT